MRQDDSLMQRAKYYAEPQSELYVWHRESLKLMNLITAISVLPVPLASSEINEDNTANFSFLYTTSKIVAYPTDTKAVS